jgi:Cu(I)/Ag(I) efflux system protein CusF
MKKTIMMLALALAMMLNAVTAGPVWAQAALTDGLVTKVDASAGKITIKHGPMKKFDMDDGMTMVYRAQDPAMLKAVKAGDKIKFDAEHVNGQFIVTKIEKAK